MLIRQGLSPVLHGWGKGFDMLTAPCGVIFHQQALVLYFNVQQVPVKV